MHVGNRPFGSQSGDVYYSMNNDFMRSERETIEFLLELYPVMVNILTIDGSSVFMTSKGNNEDT